MVTVVAFRSAAKARRFCQSINPLARSSDARRLSTIAATAAGPFPPATAAVASFLKAGFRSHSPMMSAASFSGPRATNASGVRVFRPAMLGFTCFDGPDGTLAAPEVGPGPQSLKKNSTIAEIRVVPAVPVVLAGGMLETWYRRVPRLQGGTDARPVPCSTLVPPVGTTFRGPIPLRVPPVPLVPSGGNRHSDHNRLERPGPRVQERHDPVQITPTFTHQDGSAVHLVGLRGIAKGHKNRVTNYQADFSQVATSAALVCRGFQ